MSIFRMPVTSCPKLFLKPSLASDGASVSRQSDAQSKPSRTGLIRLHVENRIFLVVRLVGDQRVLVTGSFAVGVASKEMGVGCRGAPVVLSPVEVSIVPRTRYFSPEPLDGQVGNMEGSLGAGASLKVRDRR